MKKTFTILLLTILILSGSRCIFFNQTGLNPGHEKGFVASRRIQEAAIIQDAVFYNIIAGRPSVSILAAVSHRIAGISHGEYYKTEEVDKCISDIQSMGTFLSGGIAASTCNLKPDQDFFDP